MLNSNVGMETSLAKLVFGLTPIQVSKILAYQDKDFQQVLGLMEKKDRDPEICAVDVTIKIVIGYNFEGIDCKQNGGFVAVFKPEFTLWRSDQTWRGLGFWKDDPRPIELMEITQCGVVEFDIPDIEEVKTAWISVIPGKLVEGNPVWMIRK